ncbi:unnamed protein product [Vitrella brassicaformis CCMP3155]|uniref:Uncharacterized protein n=1 Tax=Vitrella brassicaformis (strain CCMP3155) TaxID=1169540 RepID=A0A0G4GF23_VITBC|nr:unnamed protein product [Vitrella brassicaformis CCMP3155]|eukprot:CEM28090.1 unnamed protein product [Vitrella brassicaformis CCMP3155]
MPVTQVASSGGEMPVEQQPDSKFVLEERTPLPKSLMWKLLKSYYAKMAIAAWTQNVVPSFVTSNSRLAQSYGRLITNHLRDWFACAGVDKSQPVRIIEIGAGHGKFTFLLLRALLRYKDLWESLGLPPRPFQYVYTDLAEANIRFCQNHASLQEFIQEGWLDFAIFDGNDETAKIDLRIKGGRLGADGPVIAICNYVLDSLVTDGYRVNKKQFSRALATLYSKQSETDLTDSDIISRMTLSWAYQPVDIDTGRPIAEPAEQPPSCPEGYSQVADTHTDTPTPNGTTTPATDPHGDGPAHPLLCDPNVIRVIKRYGEMFERVSFVVPLGAFQLVNSLRALSGDRLMMIIGDKAYKDADDFQGVRDPHVAIHGSLSFMLNLHAVKVYFETLGGFHTSTPYKDTFQITGLWCVANKTAAHFPSARGAFADHVYDFPSDALISWKNALTHQITWGGTQCSLKDILALLRYSGHDTEVFVSFHKDIRNACQPTYGAERRYADLMHDLELVFENWYQLRSGEDVPDILGGIFMRIGDIDRAIKYFEVSLQYMKGEAHPSTYVNLANCYKAKGRLSEARAYAEGALRLDPKYPSAIELLNKLQSFQDQTHIALIGGAFWNRYEQAPILSLDKRFRIKAIFAFNQEEADGIKKELQDAEGVDVYVGNAQFFDLINRTDIHACVVDLHHKLVSSYLPRIWAAGKHTLTPSPFVFSGRAAQELAYNQRANILGSGDLSWCAVEPFRQPEAFAEAKMRLAALGIPVSVSIYGTFNPFGRVWHSQYSTTEALSIELMRYLVVLKGVLNEALMQSICAEFQETNQGCTIPPIPIPGMSSSDIKLLRDNTKPSTTTDGSSTSNDADAAGKGPATLGIPKQGGTLSGVFRLTHLVEGGGSGSGGSGGVGEDSLHGTFLLAVPCLESSTTMSIMCTRGSLDIVMNNASWTLSSQTTHGASYESTIMITGNQSAHDEWLKLMRLGNARRKEAAPTHTSDRMGAMRVEKSVLESIADTATLDGILSAATQSPSGIPGVIKWAREKLQLNTNVKNTANNNGTTNDTPHNAQAQAQASPSPPPKGGKREEDAPAASPPTGSSSSSGGGSGGSSRGGKSAVKAQNSIH